MRLVVDCSALESPTLAHFLSTSPQNCAVLIDVASYDVFAAGFRAADLLSPFARHRRQAVLLRPSWQIWRLRPRKKGYVPRLIDAKQTRAFPKYCELLATGNPLAVANVIKKAEESREFGRKLLDDAAPLLKEMQGLIASYDGQDLRALRSGHRLSAQFCDRLTYDVAKKTARELWDTQGVRSSPDEQEIKASLIFRLTVCSCAFVVRRAADGNVHKLSAATFRNDLNDCFYAAYATLFDGLLSCDEGLVKTYNLSLDLLRGVFGCRKVTADKAVLATTLNTSRQKWPVNA